MAFAIKLKLGIRVRRLVGSWFTTTGVLGMLLILNGSLLAAMTLIKEREAGTLEQLLMSPATPTQIVIAKITPLFILLSAMAVFAMFIVRFRVRRALSRKSYACSVR